MMNLIGDIPEEINTENKRYLIKHFAFRFQRSFNQINLKKYKNIEAYLTSLLKNTKTNDKERMWCLLALYVLKDFAISDNLSMIEDTINGLILTIDCINPKIMIDYINQIAVIFITLKKNTLICLPSENLKEEAFLRNKWEEIFNIIDKNLKEDDIDGQALTIYYNLLSSKETDFISKKSFLADTILFDLLIPYSEADKNIFSVILQNMCMSVIKSKSAYKKIIEEINYIQ